MAHRHIWLLLSPFLGLFLVLIAGCGDDTHHDASPPPGDYTTNSSGIDSNKVSLLLKQAHARIDPSMPGRGVTDYPGNTVEDVPKSMAMVLLGDIYRSYSPEGNRLKELASAAGNWLLEHVDENADQVIGWGVPVAWDAYGDGSINPVNTEYSISTGIVIDALLSWLESGQTTKRGEILNIVVQAAEPYLNPNTWTPAGMLPYSLRTSDQRYDTINSAAYLAGELQRLSLWVTDPQMALRMRQAADSTMLALLQHRQINPQTGSWYWHYSVQEAVSNDLPHASYIVEGIRTYVANGGRHGDQFDRELIVNHLLEFTNPEDNTIRGWPLLSEHIKDPARLYGLGMAMHMACTEASLLPLRQHLVNAVEAYKSKDGRFQKFPTSHNSAPLVVAEYESYLYFGLSTCSAAAHNRNIESTLTVEKPGLAPVTPPPLATTSTYLEASDSKIAVPFVRLTASGQPTATRIQFDRKQRTSSVQLSPNGDWLHFPHPGVPVARLSHQRLGEAFFFREFVSGQLDLYTYRNDELQRSEIDFQVAPDREVIYRASGINENHAIVIYYDNPTSKNFYQLLIAKGNDWQPLGTPVALPSLEDPAGLTYEMIPKVFVFADKKQFFIVGGTLSATVSMDGELSYSRLDDCIRVIEAVLSDRGPTALCSTKNGSQGRYHLSYPDNDHQAHLLVEKGIPWQLQLSDDGSIQISYAKSPSEILEMLVHDLTSLQQAGWSEFGINNREGRIPWSQIYYLNGLMDILYLADNNQAAREMFGPIAADVRTRLDLEISLIDWHWQEGRFPTQAFTVDRSPALFAVQTGRLLMLLRRYLSETSSPQSLTSYPDVEHHVVNLVDHIDVLAFEGESETWIPTGTAHLRWPKGSKFYFDGVAVPYNHQNEWAYSLFYTNTRSPLHNITQLDAAEDILTFFLSRISEDGALPKTAWDYWWGTAYDGWQEEDGVSVNKPAYAGDKGKAWISFRTIDAMSALSLRDRLPSEQREHLESSVLSLVNRGLLYPFASYELYEAGRFPRIQKDVALDYARVSSPWELQSATWALFNLGLER